MNEFFEFLVAQLSAHGAIAGAMLGSLLLLVSFVAYVQYKKGLSNGRETVYFVLGMNSLCISLMTGAAALDWANFDKLTAKAFNEQISSNAYNFQGTANCQNEDLYFEGSYKTEVKVKEQALSINVPVAVHLKNSRICSLGYYPKKVRIKKALQDAADDYIHENSTQLYQALLEVTKPNTVEVKAVPQFKGVTVEVPLETPKATITVQDSGRGPSIKPKQPVNINTNISGQ